MSETPLERAHRHLMAAADALAGVVGSGADQELLSVVTLCEGATRRLGRVTVDAVAVLERRGFFIERGYTSTAVGVERPGGLGAVRGPPPRGGRGAGRLAHQRGRHACCRPGCRPPARCSPPARPACGTSRSSPACSAAGRRRGSPRPVGRGRSGSWPPRPISIAPPSCTGGAPLWWRWWIRTANHPTTGHRRG